MTIQELLVIGVASDAELQVMVMDWNPKQVLQTVQVIDSVTGSSTTINTPLLIVTAGPSAFRSYDASGYEFPLQYSFD